jgi:dTDP-4-amino-4,6-dideoxygalactose transaminase
LDNAIATVLSGTEYILGSALKAFEQAFASYTGLDHCVGVASGTDALALALRAAGVRPGDEVITTAMTFTATAQAILHCGAIPRFVDVDHATRCIDPAAVLAAISSRTTALVPVHLFGYPADMPALLAISERLGLVVIEDCAQAHGGTRNGRKLGTYGHAAAYSFYPTKNLGCIGDGGAVVTNDPSLADRVRSLRNYGFQGSVRVSQAIGFNSRLDEIQAAILIVLLGHLDAGNVERRAIAARYRLMLQDSNIGLPPDDPGCVYHQYAITCQDRDRLARHLAKAGVGSAVHYACGLHRHPAFSSGAIEALPVTDALSRTLLSLPIQPEIADQNVEQISAAIRGLT